MKKPPRIRRATTAYELLTDVCAVITEEPKRYYQGVWGTRKPERRGLTPPACGTVCCVAGWVQTLVQPKQGYGISTAGRAKRILGIDDAQADVLFDGAALHDFTRDLDLPKPGSRAYARLGVRHIRKFQAEYATQLKAKIVTPARIK